MNTFVLADYQAERLKTHGDKYSWDWFYGSTCRSRGFLQVVRAMPSCALIGRGKVLKSISVEIEQHTIVGY